MQYIIYIPLPTNKVVLDKDIHSILVNIISVTDKRVEPQILLRNRRVGYPWLS